MEIHVLFMEILCTVQSIIILLIIGIVAESSIIVCTYILTFMYAHIYTHSCTAKPVLERVQKLRLSADDFDTLEVIGRGAFGEVKVGNQFMIN
jgi:hypothetical protein